MRTKTRLTLWLGIVTLLVLVLAIVGLGTIWKLRTENQDVLKANYNSIEYARTMLAALDEPAGSNAAVVTFGEALELQRANVTEPGEQELTDRLVVSFNALRADPVGDDVRQVVRGHVYGLIDINRNAIVVKSKAVEASADKALMWISVVGTLCFLIAFTLFFSLPERIAEPIRKLTEGIDRIAAGHYRERVDLKGGGEFAHMAERFNAMAGELERWENSSLARIMEEKARAEAVINSLQDASIGMDEQGNVLFANQQALDLLAMTSADIVGKPGPEAARTSDLLQVLLSGNRQGPLKIVKDGREQFFTMEHVPINKGTEHLGTMVVVRNVTPFEEKDRAKSHFLATISHELKTPLASTDIGLTLLERNSATSLTTEQSAILADLRKDHQRLVRIVSELLDLSQAETGNIRVNIATCALDQLIEEALAAIKVAGQQKNIRFLRPSGHDGLQVVADPDKAVWVLVNVLGNAVRHSPHAGVITLGVEPDNGRVKLSISDQGPGVPVAERDRLFQRFTPGSNAAHGNGLGLSIAREFMRAMGGSISYLASEHDGASFVIAFDPGLKNEAP